MSRWPRGIDAAYLQHESDERLKRVLALDVRYGDCARTANKPRLLPVEKEWSPYPVAKEQSK